MDGLLPPHRVHVVIDAILELSLQHFNGGTLWYIAVVQFCHLVFLLVGQGKELDATHSHLEHDLAVLLFNTKALEVLKWLGFDTLILTDKCVEYFFRHKDEIDALS